MEQSTFRITVLFEDPFWIAVLERECEGRYEAAKITFGSEPRDYEVYAYLMCHWPRLSFSPSIPDSGMTARKRNPKRMQREIQKTLQARGISTKAQEALKLQQEAGKERRRARSKQEREEERERQFALRQEKRREKHRGH